MSDFEYRVRSGKFSALASDGHPVYVGHGYSGYGEHRNDPQAEGLVSRGPIPRGAWEVGHSYTSRNTGPVSVPLRPLSATKTYGRSGFVVHGDNSTNDASRGCIILKRAIREQLKPLDRIFVVD